MRDYRSHLVTVAKRATPTVNKHLAALVDFYTWRGLGQPQGVKRHQVPRHAPEVLGPRAKLRYLRAVGACPSARDRAIALLPLYAGSRIAEIVALDVADVRGRVQGQRPSRRQGERHATCPARKAARGPGRVARRAAGLSERGHRAAVPVAARHQDDDRRLADVIDRIT